MSGFLFAFLVTLLASLGARDQLLVARITAVQGARVSLLAVALLSTIATCAGAAWLSGALAQQVPGNARLVFAGFALVLAGGEALLLGTRRKGPQEPTRSLFAALVVLAAQQITDAVRFLVLALGLLWSSPALAAMGGAAGGAIALSVAWSAPELASHPQLPRLRRLAGLFLLLAGLVLIWRGIDR